MLLSHSEQVASLTALKKSMVSIDFAMTLVSSFNTPTKYVAGYTDNGAPIVVSVVADFVNDGLFKNFITSASLGFLTKVATKLYLAGSVSEVAEDGYRFRVYMRRGLSPIGVLVELYITPWVMELP